MRRWRSVGYWLGPTILLWGVLALLGRIPTVRAAAATDVLFVVAVLFTCVAAGAVTVQVSRSRRMAMLKATALTLGFIFGFALLELAAAARLVHWQLVFNFLRGEQQYFVPDPDLGFRHAANARWRGRSRSDVEVAWDLPASRPDRITITYDGRGYRNPTGLDQADIVLIGDSYVEGSYVSDDQVLSQRLQSRLGQPIANLGVAGYGTLQELVVLKVDALRLKPRVVIWFFFEGNDLYNDQNFENTLLASRDERATAWTAQQGWWQRSLIRNALQQLRLLLFPLAPRCCPSFGILTVPPRRGQKVFFGPEAAFPWTEFEQGRWERAKETLRQAARLTQEQSIKLMVVYVPIKFRVYGDFIESPPPGLRRWALWPLPEFFFEFCRAEGLTCLDLTGPLRDSVRAGGLPYALVDSHWSPEGHELVAARVEELLNSLGWLPSSSDRRQDSKASGTGLTVAPAELTPVGGQPDTSSRPWKMHPLIRRTSTVR